MRVSPIGQPNAPRRPPTTRSLVHAAVALLCAAATTLAFAVSTGGSGAVGVPAHRQANVVAVVPVRGVIDQVTQRSMERRIAQARRAGAGAVVIQLDTPGGEMRATLNICHRIKNDFPANTVAWVDPSAYSAGTYIALACREIVMSPNARMGDAAPILEHRSLSATERAKVESPLLTEAVDSARRGHYDENLVKAFVTLTPELWMLEHTVTGERVVVDSVEYHAAMGESPPAAAPRPTTGAAASAPGRLVPHFSGGFLRTAPPPPSAGSTTSSAESAQQVEFQQSLPPVRPPLAESDRGKWRLLHQVVPAGQLLTLTAAEAEYYGLSAATIASTDELQRWFGASRIIVFEQSWTDGLLRFLIHPLVRGLLLVIFFVALFVEMSIPGVGIFGATALAALLLVVGAPWIAGLAELWEILLIVIGLGLVAVEILVLPGFGVAGVAGAICLLVGIIGVFTGGGIAAAGYNEILRAVATIFGSVFVAGAAMWMISRQLESLPFFRRFMLTAEIAGAGPTADRAGAAAAGQRALAPGDLGVAATDLRTSGRGSFDGRLVDVQSTVGYIEKGTPIRVVAVCRFEVEVEVAR